jgi:galactoside 2-L-fucosyltransferase 1/2
VEGVPVHHLHRNIIDNELLIPEENPEEIRHENVTRSKFKNFVTARFQGRLGNMMFVYASLVGLAKQNDLIPCLLEDNYLRQIFRISLRLCPDRAVLNMQWAKFTEHRFAAYDHRTNRLNVGINIDLVGYFQSWKYFDLSTQQIRDEFVFDEQIAHISRTFLRHAGRRYYPEVTRSSRMLYVGVHIRRGDMMDDYNQERGYTVADSKYLDAAMSYFKAKYSLFKIIFVVCSDDMQWSKQHLSRDIAPVVFSIFDDLEQDLSLLSETNHTIMTVGTYGWWGAWLAGGEVLYYKDYPLQGSSIDANLEPMDYFEKEWIGL